MLKYLRGELKRGIEDMQGPLPPSRLLLGFRENVQNNLRKANAGHYR